MNVLSLFDGISCGRIALEKSGIKIDKYYASEINKHAIQVSKHNYHDIIQLGDIKDFELWDIDWESIDLVIGGSPCQGFSFAGKQLNFEDPRSKLFFIFLDICKKVAYHNPTMKFLLENVRMKKESLDVISELMGVQPIFICSSSFSAQKRKRWYWTNINVKNIPKNNLCLDDILESRVEDYLYLNEKQINRAIEKHKAQVHKTGSKMGTVKFPTPRNEKSKCLTALVIKGDRSVTHIQDEKGIRILSPLEREKLQTLPDNYTNCVSDRHRVEMIGSGWTIDVIAHIFSSISNSFPATFK